MSSFLGTCAGCSCGGGTCSHLRLTVSKRWNGWYPFDQDDDDLVETKYLTLTVELRLDPYYPPPDGPYIRKTTLRYQANPQTSYCTGSPNGLSGGQYYYKLEETGHLGAAGLETYYEQTAPAVSSPCCIKTCAPTINEDWSAYEVNPHHYYLDAVAASLGTLLDFDNYTGTETITESGTRRVLEFSDASNDITLTYVLSDAYTLASATADAEAMLAAADLYDGVTYLACDGSDYVVGLAANRSVVLTEDAVCDGGGTVLAEVRAMSETEAGIGDLDRRLVALRIWDSHMIPRTSMGSDGWSSGSVVLTKSVLNYAGAMEICSQRLSHCGNGHDIVTGPEASCPTGNSDTYDCDDFSGEHEEPPAGFTEWGQRLQATFCGPPYVN